MTDKIELWGRYTLKQGQQATLGTILPSELHQLLGDSKRFFIIYILTFSWLLLTTATTQHNIGIG